MQRHETAEARSVRTLRVGEQVRHALAEILLRGDVHDPLLASHSVSVTEVRMSPDLRHASVFVKTLGERDEAAIIKALKHHVRYLRGEVSKRVKTRYAAELHFLPDESFEEGGRIDALLRSPAIARDLDPQG